jgi:RNA-directed DNA polymerase
MSLATPEAIRTLQRKLYGKAKAEPTFRFYQLYDKIWRSDVLGHAYVLARANKGAPGVDGVSFAQIEAAGLGDWLVGMQDELKAKRYRPQPVRRVLIPKPGGGERPLGIPTVRDRVVQTAAKLILEPIFEADLDDAMHGYRPRRSGLDAVKAVHGLLIEGYTQVVDADLSKYFDTIPHDELLASVAIRIVDREVLRLIKAWLQAPVQEDGPNGPRLTGGKQQRQGTPQGGVISPLLANRYFNRFLRYWRKIDGDRRFAARVVNYADDFVILSRGKAAAALAWTRTAMQRLGLQLNETKTCIRETRHERFAFLGYSFGLHHQKRNGRRYLGASPSDRAVQRLKDKVGELLRPQSGPWEEIRDRLNRMLVGWANYFSHGTLRKSYRAIDAHVRTRVRGFLQRRHKVSSRGTGQFSHARIFGEWGVRPLSRAQRGGLS